MSKKLDELNDLAEIIYMSGYVVLRDYCIDIAEQIQEQGYRRFSDILDKMEEYKEYYEELYQTAKATIREEVAREIFEELSATIMPLVESHNKIAENTGDILWGHKADGLETALLALKGIIRKYGVK